MRPQPLRRCGWTRPWCEFRSQARARSPRPEPSARSLAIRSWSHQCLMLEVRDAAAARAQAAHRHVATPRPGAAGDAIKIIGGRLVMVADDRRGRRHANRRDAAFRAVEPDKLLFMVVPVQ